MGLRLYIEEIPCICIEGKALVWRENLTLELIAEQCPVNC